MPRILENHELYSREQAQCVLNGHLLALAPRLTAVDLHYQSGDSELWLVEFLRAASSLNSCVLVGERYAFRDITPVLRACLSNCRHVSLHTSP